MILIFVEFKLCNVHLARIEIGEFEFNLIFLRKRIVIQFVNSKKKRKLSC